MKSCNIRVYILIFLFVLTNATSCKEDCVNVEIAACIETAPTDELCQAYFERWFYNQGKSSCEMIAYSGCSSRGFETQTDCEACKCN